MTRPMPWNLQRCPESAQFLNLVLPIHPFVILTGETYANNPDFRPVYTIYVCHKALPETVTVGEPIYDTSIESMDDLCLLITGVPVTEWCRVRRYGSVWEPSSRDYMTFTPPVEIEWLDGGSVVV